MPQQTGINKGLTNPGTPNPNQANLSGLLSGSTNLPLNRTFGMSQTPINTGLPTSNPSIPNSGYGLGINRR